ncbi:MFS general substrate transporter [Venustampulla echinocandica]|uniref:MFS general substrate transporter n=1 Tax=Venustampulla echinocandica TaxID=2656787 RepID=A0A370TS47_9HELO|nr:MFS general substrate transporter [Venustampulla echinocandica]RDL38334.1 MFS general substrate transporter [Venustampulla echinocandica]
MTAAMNVQTGDNASTHAPPVKIASSNAIAEKAVTDTEIEKGRPEEKCKPKGKGKPEENAQPTAPKAFGFYAIIVALCLTGLLTALEATITSTALPTITAVLGGGSGLCGGAVNIEMLVAGRLVQGIGAGAINVLIEIIVCDLLSLRERGRYLGLMFGMIAVGTVLGPLFGGLIVQHSSWRWVFYLNVPIGGLALVALVLFLKVKSDNTSNFTSRLKRIDWFGNLIFVLSMVAVLTALSWAGSKYPWSSFHIIVPLIMALAGGVLFMFFEASRFCANPTMPLHLFSNRTSGTGFALTFLSSISGISPIYFLPVYFQAVLSSTPARAGVQLLPTILGIISGAIVAGVLFSKFGRYRPLQHAGFTLMVIGFGLLSLLKANSTMGQWVGFQIVGAVGTGLVLPVLLPSIQAPLNEADTALSTSTWAFIRSFGLIWGATILTVAFNNRFNSLAHRITDPVVVAELLGGRAYEHATKVYMQTITDPATHAEVVGVFIDSLKLAWYVSIAFAGLGFVLVVLMKVVPLRKELDTQFGIEESDKSTKTEQPISEQLTLATNK